MRSIFKDTAWRFSPMRESEAAAPFNFVQTAAQPAMTLYSHKLAPEAVLDIYRRVTGETPPPAFVLSVAGRGELRWRLPFSGRGTKAGTCLGFPVATPAISVARKLAGRGENDCPDAIKLTPGRKEAEADLP